MVKLEGVKTSAFPPTSTIWLVCEKEFVEMKSVSKNVYIFCILKSFSFNYAKIANIKFIK